MLVYACLCMHVTMMTLYVQPNDIITHYIHTYTQCHYYATHTHACTVNWSIHSKRSSPRTDSRQFAENLKKIMEDMKNLYS